MESLEEGLNSAMLRILPAHDTGMGANALQKFGDFQLRPHPGVEWEHVEHMGFVKKDVEYDDPSLLWVNYALQPAFSTLGRNYFYPGGRFYSVMNDTIKTGYHHILKNVSPEVILLKIDAKRKI